MKKKIFVADSYHSNQISHLLQQLYGDTVEVFCDSSFLPHGLPGSVDTLLAMKSESSAEQFHNSTNPEGVDLFFLSAKIILQGDINPTEMKNVHGKLGSKVVAMSTMPVFLEDVKNQGFDVDFFHDKHELAYAKSVTDLRENEKQLLLSYLQ